MNLVSRTWSPPPWTLGVVWLDCAGEVVPDYGFMPMERELAGGPGAELKAANG